MSIITADRAVDYALSHLVPIEAPFVMRFHGGEPLLNFDIVERCVEKTKAALPERTQFEVTTNACLLDAEIGKFLMKNFARIGISIDGAADSHDMHRKLVGGEGSFYRVKKALSHLDIDNPVVSARMTVRHDTVEALYDNVCYLLALGFTVIEPVPDASDSEWTRQDLAMLQTQFYRLSDLQIDLGSKAVICGITASANRLINMPCDVGGKYMHISPQGGLYPCALSVGNPKYCIGHIDTGLCQARVNTIKELNIKENESCIGCARYGYCNGTRCKIINEINTGNAHLPSMMTCKLENLLVKTGRYYKEKQHAMR